MLQILAYFAFNRFDYCHRLLEYRGCLSDGRDQCQIISDSSCQVRLCLLAILPQKDSIHFSSLEVKCCQIYRITKEADKLRLAAKLLALWTDLDEKKNKVNKSSQKLRVRIFNQPVIDNVLASGRQPGFSNNLFSKPAFGQSVTFESFPFYLHDLIWNSLH